MIRRKAGLSALAALALATAVAGCGPSKRLAAGCVIADVSSSTQQARTQYVAAFRQFATEIGTDGSGQLCVILAAGDPASEGRLVTLDVGPTSEHRDSPDYAPGEIATRVRQAADEMQQVLADPAIRRPGSSLVEAADVVAPKLHPGDRLLFLSDGVQNSLATGSFRNADLSPAARSQMIDGLAASDLLAHLKGVQVEFPLMLIHPGGRGGISQTQDAAIRAFWREWASRAGGNLVP